MTQKEAEEVAEKVNSISFDYHLSHATFACDKLIQQRYKEFIGDKLEQISKDLQMAVKRKDRSEIKRLTEEKTVLDSKIKYRIFVEYIPDMDRNAGRVVKTNNQLVINLPKVLLDESRTTDGKYNKVKVKELRRLMAHELGHIALHVKELLEIDSLNGERDLRSEQAEKEADWFADKLLKLRTDRNEEMRKDGTIEAF